MSPPPVTMDRQAYTIMALLLGGAYLAGGRLAAGIIAVVLAGALVYARTSRRDS